MRPTAVLVEPSVDTPEEPRDLGGLLGLTDAGEVPFPLESVQVRASVIGRFARTVVEQAFRNPHASPLEAVHIFPLPPDGAVVEMELRCGPLTVRAECRERAEAERVFDEARRAGHRAGLLNAERRDVHTLRVTNIPPGERVSVRFVVIERLTDASGALEWRFPTVVAPRYIPGTPASHHGPGTEPDTDQVPDASRITPPLRLAGGTRLDLEVAIAAPVASISSSLHAVKVTMGEVVRVAPAAQATLDRDFVLRIEPAAADDTPAVRAYTDGTHTLAVVSAPAAEKSARVGRDAVFVLDVSGSMAGLKLTAAKRAIKAALRGLDEGDRFRVVAFNTEHRSFISGFSLFDDVTLKAADAWIERLQADGGTELLPPLLDALSGDTPAGRVRTVLVITDGEVGNDDELSRAVARHRGQTLVFTVGIDTSVNEALLKRLARLGGGTCDLMTPTDDIEARMADIESLLAHPVAWDVRVEGGEPARTESFHLFAGVPYSLLLVGAPATIRIAGSTASGPWGAETVPDRIDSPLGALWARERIAWLEDRDVASADEHASSKGEIVRVALAHGIVSRYTSLVAVETTTTVSGERTTVVQPVELPFLWEEEACAVPSMPAPPMMAARHVHGPMYLSLEDDGGDMTMEESPPYDDGAAGRALYDMPDESEPPTKSVFSMRSLSTGWRRSSMRPTSVPPAGAGLESTLATSQSADGSFGGDVGRTAAALLALVVLGHTSRRGARRRVVQKAARWLEARRGHEAADLALSLLARVESGGTKPTADEVRSLVVYEPEGRLLADALSL